MFISTGGELHHNCQKPRSKRPHGTLVHRTPHFLDHSLRLKIFTWWRPREKEPLPDHLLHHFQGRKFVPLDPPSFLDYKGTEVIIIGASDDLKAGAYNLTKRRQIFKILTLRIHLDLAKAGEQLEHLEEADAALGLTDDRVFKELRLDRAKYPTEPLHGEWK